MPLLLVDTSCFQPASRIDAGEEAETAGLRELAERAEAYVRRLPWAPAAGQVWLAFGLGGAMGLFLVRFDRPIPGRASQDYWIVVGDLPQAHAGVGDAATPAIALELYCYAMEGWANQALSGGDLSQVYPVKAAPTEEHARMLLDRVEFIRRELIPIANEAPVIFDGPEGDRRRLADAWPRAKPWP